MNAAPLKIDWPLTLEGSFVRLDPVRREHAELFWEVSKADLEDIFRWIPYSMKTREDFESLIDKAFAEQERGESIVFATVERASGQVVGSTRFMNIDRANRRVEIGSTWYAKRVQRSGVNTQCKMLLLAHAFEKLDCIAVEFRTHFFNHQSRRAIERLGAKLDGILRNHVIARNGTLRDTVVYSIIASEWPTVKAHLNYQLNEKAR